MRRRVHIFQIFKHSNLLFWLDHDVGVGAEVMDLFLFKPATHLKIQSSKYRFRFVGSNAK
jgi:hypothetical protein